MSEILERKLAAAWRASHVGHDEGYVLIYRGVANGWRRELTEPESYAPGNIAVPAGLDKPCYITVGGNLQSGSEKWVNVAMWPDQVASWPEVELSIRLTYCFQSPLYWLRLMQAEAMWMKADQKRLGNEDSEILLGAMAIRIGELMEEFLQGVEKIQAGGTPQ